MLSVLICTTIRIKQPATTPAPTTYGESTSAKMGQGARGLGSKPKPGRITKEAGGEYEMEKPFHAAGYMKRLQATCDQ